MTILVKGAKAGEKNIGKERAIKLTATNKDEEKKRAMREKDDALSGARKLRNGIRGG